MISLLIFCTSKLIFKQFVKTNWLLDKLRFEILSMKQKIGKMFIEEQEKEYNGTDHIYNADSFNEMTPPSSDPAYLSLASRCILSSMQAADPQAVWLMQGWLFKQRTFWKPAQIKALLTGKVTLVFVQTLLLAFSLNRCIN